MRTMVATGNNPAMKMIKELFHPTLHTAMTSTLGASIDNTKEDNGSNREESCNEDDDGVISSDTSYSNGIHTSGDDTDDDRIISPDTSYSNSIHTSGDNIDDSDEDTGYGENNESDDQGRQGSKEDVSGAHNSEAKSANKTTSRTASQNIMERSRR